MTRVVKCPNRPEMVIQDRRGPDCASVGTATVGCPNGGRFRVVTDDGEVLMVCGAHARKVERRGELVLP